MSMIDIRGGAEGEIRSIKFSDGDFCGWEQQASEIQREQYSEAIFINSIEEATDGGEGRYPFLVLVGKEDVLNLIKALNKAIELGWVK